MDALEILKQMHVEATAAFQAIESAGAGDRGALWGVLQPQLELHERIEERFVYDPVAREAGPVDAVLARWDREHEAQVGEADALMKEIGELDPAEAGWQERVTSLASTLARHIEQEENDIWPRIRTAWGDEKLVRAGRQLDGAQKAAKDGATIDDAMDAAEQA